MKNKLRFLLVLMIFSLTFIVSACGGGNGGDGTTIPNQGEIPEVVEINFEDMYVEYSGKMYQLELRGKLPNDVYARYEYFLNGEYVSEKGVIEPGEYEVVVYLEGNYEKYGLPSELRARLVIKGEGKPAEVWFEGQTFEYDGSIHSVYISGYLPADIKVDYEYFRDGQEFVSHEGVVEPGNYLVIARFMGDYEKYGLPEMLETWINVEGKVQIVDVKFENITYNPKNTGEFITLEIDGQLPDDVWVEYHNNCPTEYGEHIAVAQFHGEIHKYGLPEMMEAVITIYEDIKFTDQIFAYTGKMQTMKIESYIPSDVSVRYENNRNRETGSYMVVAVLSGEYQKYGFMDKYVAMMVIVNPGEIYFNDSELIYTGYEQSIYLNGIPEGFGIRYEYYQNGELVSTSGVTEIGVYDVYAYLENLPEGFEIQQTYFAKLTIMPDEANRIELLFGDKYVTYDGTEHSIVLEGDIPEDLEYYYYDNVATEAGTYYATVIFVGNYLKYGLPNEMHATLTIETLKVDTSTLSFNDAVFEYDNTVTRSIYVTGYNPEMINVTYYYNDQCDPGEYTVVANLSPANSNIELIGETTLTATLKIKHKLMDVNVNDIIVVNDGATYNNGVGIEFYVDQNSLPNGVYVESYENNYQTEAGSYEVKIKLRIDYEYTSLYRFNNDDVVMTITKICRIEQKKVNIEFVTTTFTYDGNVKSLTVNHNAMDVSVNVDLEGNGATDAGEYTVRVYANIIGDSKNYYVDYYQEVKMTILKANYPSYGIEAEYISLNYDGNYYRPTVYNLPSGTTLEYDKEAVSDVGLHEFNITLKNKNYNDKVIQGYVNIFPAMFSYYDLEFFGIDTTYDGTKHYVDIVNKYIIPSAYNYYPESNGFTEAGDYYVLYHFDSTDPNYESFELELWIVIRKADIDVTNLVFDDMVFDYDGQSKTYKYNGSLPQGIKSLTYENNTHTEAGSYDVIINFELLNENYNPVDSMSAKLIINPAVLDLSNITFNGLSTVYNGEAKYIYIEGDLPSYISVSYENNGKVNAGSYEVKAIFTHNLDNYAEIEPLTATLLITPKVIDVAFEGATFTYDGQVHSIYVDESQLEPGTKVTYEHNGQINAGEYTVVANIKSNSGNYVYPEKVEALLVIEKADILVTYPAATYSYNGNEYTHEILLEGMSELPEGITVTYENNTATRAGIYTAVAHFEGENQNYNTPKDLESVYELQKINYFDITLIIEGEVSYIYAVAANRGPLLYLPEIPEKPHYKGHWEISNGGGLIQSDITATLVYEKISYTIYIDTDGAVLNHPNIYLFYGEEFTLPELKKPGYEFLGYYYNDELITDGVFTYDSNIVVEAKWSCKTYHLSIVDSNSEILYEQDINYDEKFQLPYSFDSYYVFEYLFNDVVFKASDAFIFVYEHDVEIKAVPFDMELNNTFTFKFYDKNNNSLTVTNYNGEYTDLTIPSYGYFEGAYYPIVSLDKLSFNSSTLLNLTVNENIIKFYPGCFQNLTSIETLSLHTLPIYLNSMFDTSQSTYSNKVPQSLYKVIVREVGTTAGYNYHLSYGFNGCRYIKEIILPENLPSIGDHAFNGCESLEEINIPDTVTYIGGSAFRGCKSLVNFTVPSKVESIQPCTFSDCTSLTTVVLNSNITSIEQEAFYRCESLVNITLPSKLTKIGKSAFENCQTLETINIPSNVEIIGENAFTFCYNLTNVYISSNSKLNTIGRCAFERCSKLQSIYIPSGVTKIEENTFYSCTSLESVTGLRGVTYIGSHAFIYCSLLVASFDNINYVGDSALYGTKVNHITFSEGLEFIGHSAFRGTEVETIVLPYGTKTISEFAFSNCKKLITVSLPNSITSIKERAFYNCSSLAELNIPSSVTEIGPYAFYYTKIETATLPAGVTRIEDGLFDYCTNLSSVTILGNVTYVGISSFSNTAIKSLYLPESVTEIGHSAFRDTELEEFKLPSKITVINDYVFEGTNIKSFDFSNITYIGAKAFYDCDLTSVTFNNELTYIGEYAFTYNSLDNIVIPDNVTYIGNHAFSSSGSFIKNLDVPFIGTSICDIKSRIGDIYGFTKFGTINIRGGYVNADAFYNLTSLEKVIISNDVMYVEPIDCTIFTDSIFYRYGNGYYLGNSTNPYLVYVKPIDENAEVTLHPNTKFGTGSKNDDLLLEGGVYYLSYNGNKYYIAVGLESNSLKEVIINENTHYIYEYMFFNCTNLEKLVLPDSLEYLPTRLFKYLTLKELTLPYLASDRDGSFLYTMDDLFDDHNALTMDKLVINSGIITSNAIYSKDAYEIVLGADVTEIKDYAFDRSNYTYGQPVKKITIAENSKLKSIGDYAFYSYYISEINLPNGLESIGAYAFCGNHYLTTLTIPNTVTYIGEHAFYCADLEEVIFESGSAMKELGNSVFNVESAESTLKKIVLPDGLESIGAYAFYNCDSLTEITIPTTVTYIGEYAFKGCYKLESINLDELKLTVINEGTFSWCASLTTITIPNTVISIEDNAFDFCDNLTEVIFAENSRLKTIGSYVFANIYNLKSIELPEGLTTIGSYNFYNSYLNTINLPSTLTTLGIRNFDVRSFIENMEINNNIEVLDVTNFNSYFRSLTIGENVKSLSFTESSDYYPRGSMENLYISAKTENFEEILRLSSYNTIIHFKGTAEQLLASQYDDTLFDRIIFYDENNEVYQPKKIVVPSNVTKICYRQFAYLDQLESIDLNNVVEIDDYAFYNCKNLTEIIWPEHLERIGKYAFYYCAGPEKLELSVSLVDEQGFNLSNTKEVHFKAGTETIYTSYFPAIEKITFAEGVKYIDNGVLNNYTNEIYLPNTLEYLGHFDAYSGNLYYNGTLEEWLNIKGEIMYLNPAHYDINIYFRNENGEYYSIEDLVIPDTITSIESSASFTLNSLYLPNTIETCEATFHVRDLHFAGTFEEWYEICSKFNITVSLNIYVLDEEGNDYCLTWADIVIPKDWTILPKYLLTRTNSITIHDGVTEIYGNNLDTNNVYYEGSIEDWCRIKIIDGTFGSSYKNFYLMNETGLYKEVRTISIPNSIREIGNYQFYGFYNLEKVFIHDYVERFGFSAFAECDNLVLEIKSNVKEICGKLPDNQKVIIVSTNTTSLKEINCSVYYLGTPEDKESLLGYVSLSYGHSFYYYSEEKPTNTFYKYWHYDENGNAVSW